MVFWSKVVEWGFDVERSQEQYENVLLLVNFDTGFFNKQKSANKFDLR